MSDSSPRAESPAARGDARRRIEAGDAPAGQGDPPPQGFGAPKLAGKTGERRWATANTGSIWGRSNAAPRDGSARRMQADVHRGLLWDSE